MGKHRKTKEKTSTVSKLPDKPLDFSIVSVHVKPNAKFDKLISVGVADQAYDIECSISISSPALDGKANSALVDFFATLVGLKARDITIIKGHTSRNKIIRVEKRCIDVISLLKANCES
ncbi:Protein of unknown function DUF167 like protein [Aduncisulcus paluster]|uniref:Uncharacterized protein n=1 Tax=Aduncisulcus paluster TaxID=2918883 RepID=A0ABQ5KLF3_9EUKA|nr:Protein of unknown function DUF167 like protein [Aduncisulcus paluster]